MVAVEIRVDVLNNVGVLPAEATSRTSLSGGGHAPANLLSRINRISFTSVSMFVVDDICQQASQLPHVHAFGGKSAPTFIFLTATLHVLRTTLNPKSSSSASPLPDSARLGSYTALYTVPLAP